MHEKAQKSVEADLSCVIFTIGSYWNFINWRSTSTGKKQGNI